MDYTGFCKVFTTDVPKAKPVGERWYLMPEDVAAFTSGEQRKPYGQGLSLGMGGREFIPSPALLTILAQKSTRKAIITDTKAERLFLCGRDVFAEYFKTEITDGFVLVQNEHDENLGLGTITKGAHGHALLKNILDRGNYLRHDTVSLAGKKARKKDIHARR